jgi:alpha,alpha-trehalase
MILAVYEVTRDRGWLVSTMPAIRAQYRYWTREPHLAGNSGLSRPDALPAGPAPASRDDASVALNSLLFVIERDVAEILTTAGDLFESQSWLRLAEQRRRRIGELLWDATRGLFVDYDVAHRRQRPEPSADTFLPLWAGLASPEQARRLAGAALPLLERAGGLAAGGEAQEGRVGAAPSQLFAVEGLRRYGLHREADRLATAFLGTVLKGYVQHAAVFQEYDLDRREPAAREGGDRFGTTNGVFLELEAGLAPAGRAAIVAGAAAAPAR